MLTGMYVAVSVIMYVGGSLILTMGSTYAKEIVDSESKIPNNNRAYLNCIRTGQTVGTCYSKWRSADPWLFTDKLDGQTHRKWAEMIKEWSIEKSSTPENSSSARTLLEPKFFELRSLWSSTLPERLQGFSESRM